MKTGLLLIVGGCAALMAGCQETTRHGGYERSRTVIIEQPDRRYDDRRDWRRDTRRDRDRRADNRDRRDDRNDRRRDDRDPRRDGWRDRGGY